MATRKQDPIACAGVTAALCSAVRRILPNSSGRSISIGPALGLETCGDVLNLMASRRSFLKPVP